MSKKKVLIVTQEMEPYTALNEISNIARKLPQYIQEKGMEIRILMPRFGLINERRHRLHEVVRLSGMNIIVDDDDFPLIIKVASIRGARMQVYFLDNEDFFKRKALFTDEEGKPFEDNADRMIFFCKGVIETVKKFGWAPDIVHCHGWMTSLIPLYLNTAYSNDPLFNDSKILYSLYNSEVEQDFDDKFYEKASINDIDVKLLSVFKDDNEKVNLDKGAIAYSDALIKGTDILADSANELLEATDKPVLEYQKEDEFLAAYVEFYQQFLAEEQVES